MAANRYACLVRAMTAVRLGAISERMMNWGALLQKVGRLKYQHNVQTGVALLRSSTQDIVSMSKIKRA